MAIKIYRTTDRIPVNIGDVKVWLAPMSSENRIKLQALIRVEAGEIIVDQERMGLFAIRCCVKDVEGIEYADGTAYKPEIVDDVMTEDSISELLQACDMAKLMLASTRMMRVDAKTQLPPGVKLKKSDKPKRSKKNKTS